MPRGIHVHRLEAEVRDDVCQELSDLGVRLGDQDARHGLIIGRRLARLGAFWYGTGMKGARVLVVDDDADIRGLVRELLERSGYRVAAAADGREGLRALYASPPDLVLLDVNMPHLDGWQTLERIRDLSDVPVIMLTAQGAELEKVRGLKAGADDYVTKPFGRQELLARVEAHLRRGSEGRKVLESYDDGYVAIDFVQRIVHVDGRSVGLTPLEFKLLSTFVRHPNSVLSREQLLELVWGDPYGVSGDQVKIYVGYLRRKLGESAADSIETVRGFGYRYRPPEPSRTA
jgi:DNA-binding response OmpR family regulator